MNNIGSLRMVNSTFVWDINDFTNKCKAVGECIDSPYFAAGDIPINKIKWYLSLYPFGDKALDNESYLSVYLNANFCSNVSEIETSYKFYLWNSNEINTKAFSIAKFCSLHKGWGYCKFLNRNGMELKNHLSSSTDSTLSIACCIASTCYVDSANLYPELAKSLNTFFLSDNLSDVTIAIGKKKLKAHKIILSANSEVFKAMFNHNMSENNENIVKITDISCDVMTEVLRFIYCGAVKNIQLHKKKLLAAADKYSITLLKKICEEAILRDIKVDSVCEILKISDSYQCPKLKEKSINFIIKNMKAVVDTQGFKQIKDHNLLADILRQNALKGTV